LRREVLQRDRLLVLACRPVPEKNWSAGARPRLRMVPSGQERLPSLKNFPLAGGMHRHTVCTLFQDRRPSCWRRAQHVACNAGHVDQRVNHHHPNGIVQYANDRQQEGREGAASFQLPFEAFSVEDSLRGLLAKQLVVHPQHGVAQTRSRSVSALRQRA
jgi:hypothetical protein